MRVDEEDVGCTVSVPSGEDTVVEPWTWCVGGDCKLPVGCDGAEALCVEETHAQEIDILELWRLVDALHHKRSLVSLMITHDGVKVSALGQSHLLASCD